MTMKNIYDVLRQKEAELQQLQKEIEALRIAARLLSDENEARTESAARPTAVPPPASPLRAASPAKEAVAAWETGPRQFP